MRGFVALLPWIPYRLLAASTSLMARLTFAILWKYRTRMEENVSLALGDKITNPAERRALVWRAWKNFAQGILETTAIMHFSKERFIATMQLEGEEHLKHALAKGNGEQRQAEEPEVAGKKRSKSLTQTGKKPPAKPKRPKKTSRGK